MGDKELVNRIERWKPQMDKALAEMRKMIVGQIDMLEGLAICLLCKGNVLVEGVPGLAKTLAVSTFSRVVDLSFQRIQFTPDLLPADITGSLIFNMKEEVFVVEKGPIFANFVLADEINRAPAKVQSALLEAMQERQVTIGRHTHALPKPFAVMATQNPIEQEGTYPLPEAQVDRFLIKIVITYPSPEEELEILRRIGQGKAPSLDIILQASDILELQDLVDQIYVDEKLEKYIVDIVYSTRTPDRYSKLKELVPFIRFGASPRATLALIKTARASAFLEGREYVLPEDIKKTAYPVLRHRIMLSYEAQADDVATDGVIARILQALPVP